MDKDIDRRPAHRRPLEVITFCTKCGEKLGKVRRDDNGKCYRACSCTTIGMT